MEDAAAISPFFFIAADVMHKKVIEKRKLIAINFNQATHRITKYAKSKQKARTRDQFLVEAFSNTTL